MGCAFVKTSASGPIPTSRYCDHMSFLIKTSLSCSASDEPGIILSRSRPITFWMSLRIPCAADGSPFALSSITLSSILCANVTPHALTACKSTGANK